MTFERTVSSTRNSKDHPSKLFTFFAAETHSTIEGFKCLVSLTFSMSTSEESRDIGEALSLREKEKRIFNTINKYQSGDC